jgi:PAP2 superfamily
MEKLFFCSKQMILTFTIFANLFSYCQAIKNEDQIDSLKVNNIKNIKFNYKQIIIPVVFITYGLVGLESHQLLSFNTGIKEEVKEHIDQKITIDDFSQYTPLATSFGLDFFGIKGKNNFKDKMIISATSYLIMGLAVNGLKLSSSSLRPDGTSFNSFPSGHTATAFMGAEILHQEYKDKSIWIALSGYFVATGTGAFRMFNNRHWLSDVIGGAGIGILSAKAGYWLYPSMTKLFKNKKELKTKTAFIPYYDGNTASFGLVSTF